MLLKNKSEFFKKKYSFNYEKKPNKILCKNFCSTFITSL